jgi:hypothetical protein
MPHYLLHTSTVHSYLRSHSCNQLIRSPTHQLTPKRTFTLCTKLFCLLHLRINGEKPHFLFCRSTIATVATEVEVKLRPTVSRPVCLGFGLPSGTYDQIFFCLTIVGFLMLSILSDERTGLQFTHTLASRLCQSSQSRIQIPQNSDNISLSHLRLPNLEG